MSGKPRFEPIMFFNEEIDYPYVDEEKLKEMDERPTAVIRKEIMATIYADDEYIDEQEDDKYVTVYTDTEGTVHIKPIHNDCICLDLLGAQNLKKILDQKIIPWLKERENVAEKNRQLAWERLQEEKLEETKEPSFKDKAVYTYDGKKGVFTQLDSAKEQNK